MKMLTRWMCVLVLAGCAADAPEGSFVRSETGVIVTPADGAARRVRLEVRTDRIVRVTSVADANLDLPKSLMVVDSATKPPTFKVEMREGDVVLETSQIVGARFAGQWRGALHRSCRQAAARRRAVSQGGSRNFSTFQRRHRRSVLWLGPASERAVESEWRGCRTRPAQQRHRCAVRGVDAQLRRTLGQQRHHAHRQSEALRSRVARPQDPRRGRQGRWLHGALLHRRAAQARARRKRYQLSVHPRPLQLAQGAARAEGAAHRLPAYHPPQPDGDLGRNAGIREGGQSQVPALRQQLFQGVRRREAGARSLAAELGRLVSQLRRGDGRRNPLAIKIEWIPERRLHGVAAQRSVAGCASVTRSRSLPRSAAPSTTISSPAGLRTRSSAVTAPSPARPSCCRAGLTVSGRAASATPRRKSCWTWWRNIASGRFRSTTSCSTGCTGKRIPGVRTSSTRRASPTPRA